MLPEDRYLSLDIGIHRVVNVYWVELGHRDPASQARIAPTRGKAALALDALLALQACPEDYGEELARQLFSDPLVLARLSEVERAAETSDRYWRISLCIDPSAQELHTLRWELLRHPQTGRPLATSERILFSRFMVSRDWRPVQLQARTELTALIAVSAPSGPRFERAGLAPVDFEGIVASLKPALSRLSTEVLGGPEGPTTLAALETRLRAGVDILYLVSHGTFRKSSATPALFLQGDDNDLQLVEGDALATAISQLQHVPRLVVLASCESAGDGEQLTPEEGTTVQATLAGQLADAGVPAVVAMQGKISMATVAAMMPTFFEELVRDGQIDRALAVARGGVQDRPDAWMPALSTRLREGRLWYTAGFRSSGRSGTGDVWRRLLKPIRRGKLVPILGPSLSRHVHDTPFEMARQLAEANGFPMPRYDWDDLPRVHQFPRGAGVPIQRGPGLPGPGPSRAPAPPRLLAQRAGAPRRRATQPRAAPRARRRAPPHHRPLAPRSLPECPPPPLEFPIVPDSPACVGCQWGGWVACVGRVPARGPPTRGASGDK